jgi:hypothetical protein
MSALLKRVVRIALALCTLVPLLAAAHGNHVHPNPDASLAPASHHEAAGAVAVAPSHCPTDAGRACGCHGLSCTRLSELAIVDIAPAACALRWLLAAPLPVLCAAVPPASRPLTQFAPRAPPVSS